MNAKILFLGMCFTFGFTLNCILNLLQGKIADRQIEKRLKEIGGSWD